MNNVNKIRRVINLSKPVRVGDTLYVANAVGRKVTAPQAGEKIILKNGATFEVAGDTRLRRLTELTTDEAQKVIAVIDEYAEYYRNAADKAEQAEIIQKLIEVCANDLGVDDPMIRIIFQTRVNQSKNPDWYNMNIPLPDMEEGERNLLNPRDTRNTITEQSFFERYKFQILIGVIIYLLLRDKR